MRAYSGDDGHRSAPQFGASELHGDEAKRDNAAGIVRPHIARVGAVGRTHQRASIFVPAVVL
jgi:hypothetical protein